MSSPKLRTLNSIKAEGVKHEQELVKILKDNHFTAYRLPPSATKTPDIICGDGETVFLIEVKTSINNLIKIKKQQIFTLNTAAQNLKAKARVAIKFIGREGWRFIKPSDLKKHDKSFSIDYNNVMIKGITLKELIHQELQQRLI